MSYFVTPDASSAQMASAINYILANLGSNYTSNANTGVISTSTTANSVTSSLGQTNGYLYRYLDVAFADNYAGNQNFSSVPLTTSQYYGLRNTNSTVYDTNPTDYVWYKVAGGFPTGTYLWYQTFGGLQINFVVANSAPSAPYQQVPNAVSIDLTVVSTATNLQARSGFTVYTGTLGSSPATYTTTGNSTFPPNGTWGGTEVWSANPSTYTAGQNLWEIDGIYNPGTNLTTWVAPFIATLKVGSLSAITATLGAVNAGTITSSSLSTGASPPVINSTTHTISSGSGITINNDGTFGIGNSSAGLVADGTGSYVYATNLSAISANLGNVTAGTATFTASTGNYLIIDGTNQRIDVYNGGVLAVRIGKLS